jgi:RNA polymerase sigma factor CnrH
VTDTESDEALAARAQEGNRGAFDALVRRHKTNLFRFVRLYVGQPDDAYDVLQDTFISAWEGLRRYDPNRAFSPWLRTIALNKCRDFARRQAVRRRLLQVFSWQEAGATASDARAADADAAKNERLLRLDRAIAGLTPFYKEPLLLTAVSGMSQQDAATQLKTTAKAIEMRIRRARQKLAEAMARDAG